MIPKPAQYMLLSALGFSLMSLFVKLSATQGIPVMQVLMARAVISLTLTVTALKVARIPMLGHNRPLLIARGLVGFIALSMVYYSVTHLPLAVATVIQFMNPIFTAILSLFLLKEAISRSLVWCLVLSFIGLVVMVIPFDQVQSLDHAFFQTVSLSPLALGIALCGAVLSALAYTIVRKLGPTEHPLVIIFYFPLVCIPAALPFIYDSFVVPTQLGLVYLLCVGCFTQVGQVYLTKAMAIESAGKATAYSYSQVIFASLWGLIFLSEVPTLGTVIGGCLILFGAYLNIAMKARAE